MKWGKRKKNHQINKKHSKIKTKQRTKITHKVIALTVNQMQRKLILWGNSWKDSKNIKVSCSSNVLTMEKYDIFLLSVHMRKMKVVIMKKTIKKVYIFITKRTTKRVNMRRRITFKSKRNTFTPKSIIVGHRIGRVAEVCQLIDTSLVVTRVNSRSGCYWKHKVYTSIYFMFLPSIPDPKIGYPLMVCTFWEETKVEFVNIDDSAINAYIHSGEAFFGPIGAMVRYFTK